MQLSPGPRVSCGNPWTCCHNSPQWRLCHMDGLTELVLCSVRTAEPCKSSPAHPNVTSLSAQELESHTHSRRKATAIPHRFYSPSTAADDRPIHRWDWINQKQTHGTFLFFNSFSYLWGQAAFFNGSSETGLVKLPEFKVDSQLFFFKGDEVNLCLQPSAQQQKCFLSVFVTN